MAGICNLYGDLGDFSHHRVIAGQTIEPSIYSPRMQDKIQKQILDAFFIVLRPVARILLRYNIGFREFAEVAKMAFVDVATSDYGIRGRPTNISRVAVMTGLTRKEVRRLRDQLLDTSSISVKSTPLATIIHRWHSEDEFLSPDGSPALLPFSGEEASFSALVRKFGGDIPPGAMRTELKRVGVIEEHDDGSVSVLKRSIRPDSQVDNLCMSLSHGVYAHMCNVANNTNPDRDEDAPGWGQRTVFSADIRAEDLVRIRRICNERVFSTAVSFDDLFMAYEKVSDEEEDTKDLKAVAITMCYFEEHDESVMSLWRE